MEGKSDELKELYEQFRGGILSLSSEIEITPLKFYIAYKKSSNIVDIQPQLKQLKLFVNAKKGTLDDPKNIARDVSAIGHHGNGDYEIIVNNSNDLEYILSLIKQLL